MKKSNSGAAKLDRKTVERNRRIHMKGLCCKLASVIPHRFKQSKDILSQQDQLKHASIYINNLKKRIESLKKMKEQATRSSGTNVSDINNNNAINAMMTDLKSPLVELRELGSSIEVILISGLKKNFMLYEAITILEEEGAEVVTANYSTVGDKVFHTIHAQVRISRVGVETSSVWKRLQELIYWSWM